MRIKGGSLLLVLLGTKLTLLCLSGCNDDDPDVSDGCIDCSDANQTDQISSADAAAEVSDSGDTSVKEETAFCDGDTVWHDSINDLCWQNPHPESAFTWDAAILYCERLSLASHEDWELPDIDQLRSLIQPGTGSAESYDRPHCDSNIVGGICEASERAPACLELRCDDECGACKEGEGPGIDGCYWDPKLEDSCVDHGFWSSSIVADEDRIWGVDYKTAVIGLAPVGQELFIRCVRSGPRWQNDAKPDNQPDGGIESDTSTGSDAGQERDSGEGNDAEVDSGALVGNDAAVTNDAGSIVDTECRPGLYQGFLNGSYSSPAGLGSIAINGTLFFRLTESEPDIFDVSEGRIEIGIGVEIRGDITGQLNCRTGETVDWVISGNYSYAGSYTYTGTMSASYDKDNWAFEGTWQADDEVEGYGGSGTWEAMWVEP